MGLNIKTYYFIQIQISSFYVFIGDYEFLKSRRFVFKNVLNLPIHLNASLIQIPY